VANDSDRAPLTSTVVRGAGLSAVAYVTTQLVTILAYALLARLASPAMFGTFAAAAILVTAGTFLTESGMTAAIVRRPGEIDAAAATATVSTFVGGALLSVLSLALSPLVGVFFRNSEIGVVCAALSGLFFLHGVAVVPGALLQRNLSLRPRLVVEPLSAVALGAVSAIALLAGLGVWGLAIGAYAAAVVRTLALWLLAGWVPRLGTASWALWRDLSSYARHVVASEAINQSSSIATTALVGRVLGTAALGQFRYGWRIATATSGLTSAGAYILLPTFSRVASDAARFRKAFERSLHVSSLVFFPLSFLLLALGEPIAVLLFGPPWAEAGRVLMALSGFAVYAGIGSVTSETVKAAGRPDVLPRAHGLAAVASIALMLAFLPFGAVGAALGISIGVALSVVYSLDRAVVIVGASRRTVARRLATPAFAGAVSCLVAFALDRGVVHAGDRQTLAGLLLLGVELLLSAAIYVGIVVTVSKSAALEVRAARSLIVARRPSSHRHAGDHP
jgi:O-antigen/teichoic acid export membrane protein